MDIVYFSSIDWDFLWQRPQHLVSRLAASHRILFVEPPTSRRLSRRHDLSPLAPNVYGYTPPPTLPFKNVSALCNRLSYRIVRTQVKKRLKRLGFSDLLLWVNQPQAVALVGHFNERLVCYDCMDDHESFEGFVRRRYLRNMETELFERADMVLTLSQPLHDKACAVAAKDRVFLVRDGGDPAHFTMDAPPHPALQGMNHPLIGFVGALYEWVDTALIEHIARCHPDWSIVLIGPVKSSATARRLSSMPNLHLLGRQPYGDLPGYIRHFDACLLPFLTNRHMACADPIILYDYLACGKPVISTDFPAARSFGDVIRIADGADGFVEAIGQAMQQDTDDRALQRRQRVLPHSWDHRTEDIQDMIRTVGSRPEGPRVSHLVVGPAIGGVEQHAVDLVLRLKRTEGISILVGEGPSAHMMRAGGIRTRAVSIASAHDLSALIRLIRILRQERPALLHTHDRRGNLFGWLTAPFSLPCKRVATVHRHLTWDLPASRGKEKIQRNFIRSLWKMRRYIIDRMMLNSADHLIAVSRSVAEALTNTLGLPKSRISVIHHGVDLARFDAGPTLGDEARESLTTSWSVPPDHLLVGVVGRLEIEKGSQDILDILPRIIREAPSVTILIVGEGALRSHLEQRIRDEHLEAYVRLTGFQTDIPRLLSALDMVVVPSHGEAFGMVVVEAMAMARPVVAYAVGGIPEIITNGENGILIPPDDRERLAREIIALLKDESRRTRIGHAGRRSVEQHFTADRMVEETQAVYRAVLNP